MFKEKLYFLKSQRFLFDIIPCDEQARKYLINNPIFQSLKNAEINLPIKKFFVFNGHLIMRNDSFKKIGEATDD